MTAGFDDLRFATVDLGKEGDPADGRVSDWLAAWARGFHLGRPSEKVQSAWLEHVRTDQAMLRGAWLKEPKVGPGTIPVATYASFDKTLNVGGAEPLQSLRMITDVTVAPTHRRRGLLRRLITDDLQDAVDRGVPLAALTVSEGAIYGRFGFGLATYSRSIEVDTTSRFGLREPVAGALPAGRVEMVEPAEAWPTVEAVYARFHATTRGSVERPLFYRTMLTAELNLLEGSEDALLRAAVHLGPEGEPDGYVHYRKAEQQDGWRTMEVVDLVALTPAAYLRLWRFLADIDLVHRVRWSHAPMDDPLPWALLEPHVAKTTGVGDMLWVRVLDVPAALEARPWGADGSVVLEVDDPLGHAAGRWLVRTEDGRATVTRADEAPGVRLAADVLGSLYLGGVPVSTLYGGGRLAGDGVDTLAAMADVGPPPYCITGF